ncbi:GGDEF domain-containing protein [Mesorhizobium sp. NBSH29]|uniref:GGDEF domain-containing protein n=1 Tax=Mesorhizobium sp. NBSH29 TaxID=2654249 RepID=UPI0018968663|nr:diguanylate cyclase [Mesorhizobium sp. NBSH29]
MTEISPSLKTVEAFIARRHKGLDFPPELEQQREIDMRERRIQRFRAAIPTLIVIYNLFLICDWLLIPDQFYWAFLQHFGLVTPWIIAIAWVISRNASRVVRESLAASIPIVISAQVLAVFLLTTSPAAAHYQYFVLLVVLYMNTIQRLPHRYALTASIIIVIMHSIAVVMSDQMSWATAAISTTTLSVAAYLTLVSNFYLERDSRRSYLHTLRDRLRHDEVENEAKHDPLTDLANRRYLTDRMQELWKQGDVISPVAVILLDIDHFKPFNDWYGHTAGDSCLKRIAACIRAELRGQSDLAVRYGGEELLVLLPNIEASDAIRIAERIRRSIESLAMPHEGMGARAVVTASFGVAAAPVSTISGPELIAAADVALYAAKRNGRNQVWPPLMRAKSDADATVHALRKKPG